MLGSLSGRRFALVIGDDGALLVHLAGRQVRDAWFVPGDAEEGPAALAEYLAGDPKAPLTVVVDVLEQVYRDEALPKVGLFDRHKVLRRRIELAFPNDAMRAALPVRKPGTAGSSFLLTALPLSATIARWMALLDGVRNPFQGFSLLPLESLRMARRLAAAPDGGDGRRWSALISLHVTGGFRQIIETDDRLVVTRLTQPPADGAAPDEIAAQIEREFRSTLTYIKRMGYVDGDQLDLVVLAEPDVITALSRLALAATRVTALTPYQAGERLGLKRVADPHGGFADAVHAAWAASQRRPSLVLRTPALRQRQLLSQASSWAGRAAVAATVATAGVAAYAMLDTHALRDEMTTARQQQTVAAAELARTEAELATLPASPEIMRQTVALYEELGKGALSLPTFLSDLGRSLGDAARIDALAIDIHNGVARDGAAPKQQATRGRRQETQAQRPLEVRITVRFLTPLPDRREAVDAAYALRDRLRAQFPRHEVTVVRLPVAVLPGESLQGVLAPDDDTGDAPRTAEYTIRGDA